MGGIASYSMPIPKWPSLIGLQLYFQGYALDGGANSLGIISSNAGRATVH